MNRLVRTGRAQGGPRFLFASPFIPNPKSELAGDGIDFFYYRNTIGQGVFKLRQMQSWHPLHFLAQNLPVDSVVLENPTMRSFQREVDTGRYDVVALTFTVLSTSRILRMATWLRERHPAVEIILGGYGTAIFNDSSPESDGLARLVDHVCRGEGLGFLRAYLKDRWNVEGVLPMRQDLLPSKVSFFRTRLPISRQLCFVGSLGCTYQCVFCATSSQYGRRKIPIATPRQLHALIREKALANPRIDNAIVYDEDFLADRRRVLEFIACLDADDELREHPLLLTVFSSVRSISQYSIGELIRCRIGIVFVGVESFRDEILERETARKRTGRDVAELFRQFHDVGIHTLGSMILGWDGQTPSNVREEMDRFVALSPTLYQVMPLQALPGSPLFRRMKAEGRLVAGPLFEGVGVTRATFRYLNFTHEQVLGYVEETHRALVRRGGPSVFKMFENLVRGVETLRAMGGPEHLARAAIYRKMQPRLYLLAFMSGALFRGPEFRARWRATMKAFFRDRPLLATCGAVASTLLLPVVVIYSLAGTLRHWASRDGEQPDSIRKEYRLSSLRVDAATAVVARSDAPRFAAPPPDCVASDGARDPTAGTRSRETYGARNGPPG